MRLVTVLVASLAVVSALDYDQETSKVTLSIGKGAKVDIKFQLSTIYEDFLVFGPECKDAGSCSTEGHPVYDAAKDKVTLEDGKAKFNTFNTKLAKDVEVDTGDKTIKQDISVVVGVVNDQFKQESFPFEGVFGLKSGKDKPFDKLVSALDKKHLLIVPKYQNDTKSKPTLLLGAESKKACGEFKLAESTSDVWTNDYVRKINDLDTTFKIAPSLDKVYAVSTNGLLLFGKQVLSENEYNNLLKYKVTYGGVEIEINPQDAYELQKDKNYELQVMIADGKGFDLALPNSYFDNYCVKLAKDGDKYMVGLAERQNGVGLAAMSLATLMGMFALLRL
ncbi:unnamed protein product [Bursaphelenchus okinawaensis]|uniref:Peptidase A1 domain-containing protein n=1 Tax=Bursaphelenchus okinawaensis TaxID=465554 RepID=A0A811L1A4_9BILA|nr:unnamed protein product [Bursaphelenchus okinawaensis]CAG9114393.1 unnamed protein product [Bursaphelenchus okinawaensis]